MCTVSLTRRLLSVVVPPHAVVVGSADSGLEIFLVLLLFVVPGGWCCHLVSYGRSL